jgi:hypothetical protein
MAETAALDIVRVPAGGVNTLRLSCADPDLVGYPKPAVRKTAKPAFV